VGFKPYVQTNWFLSVALTLLIWSYDRKNVPEMTYNVSSGMLSLGTTTTSDTVTAFAEALCICYIEMLLKCH